MFVNSVFTVFYRNNIKQKINKLKTSLKHNQGCKVKLKQTNFATTLSFQWLQKQRFKNWFDKVINTMEHVKQVLFL